MREFLNVFWFVFGGFLVAAIWAFLGLLFCATIIGIPCGKELLRIAKFAVAPFGQIPQSSMSKHPIADLLWIATLGIPLLIFFVVLGAAYTITIIGIPLGKQCFKMVVLAMGPFNVDFEEDTGNQPELPNREVY